MVSVQVEGTARQSQRVPEELKKYFGDESPDQQAQPFEGLGSGVIIDAAKGYILTNNHVISQADKISVQLNDGREFDAKLIGGDDQSDIALLQILKPSNLTQITIADPTRCAWAILPSPSATPSAWAKLPPPGSSPHLGAAA